MGADFLMSWLWMPVNKNFFELNEEEVRRRVALHISGLSREERIAKLDPEGSDLDHEIPEDNDELGLALEDRIVKNFQRIVKAGDLADFTCSCGAVILASGGSSWGDDPTESFSTMNYLDAINFTDWIFKSDLEVLADNAPKLPTPMTPAEMDALVRQVLFGLLVSDRAELEGYVFERKRNPGVHQVVLKRDGEVIRQHDLGDVMALTSHFLYLIQTERGAK